MPAPTTETMASVTDKGEPLLHLRKVAYKCDSKPRAVALPAASTNRARRPQLFMPRTSQLDLREVFTPTNKGRGWFVLFWIAMTCYVVRQFTINAMATGYPIKPSALRLSEDALELIAVDALMLSSTFVAFAWQKLVVWHWVQPDAWYAYAFQHLAQAALLQAMVGWLWYRTYRWVQTGVLLLHAMVMLMKMHSYTSNNREFAVKHRTWTQLHAAKGVPSKETLDDLQAEFTVANTQYPANVTLGNFVDYLLVPALVYELHYPRIDKIRLGYLAEKVCATFGVFTLLCVTFEDYIIPILAQLPKLNMGMTILELITPVMISYLLIFYIIFECICNVFAELTRFADRNFYDDWWNSTNFDEYSRRWNRPVHSFLLRHVYLYSIDTYKMSRNSATLLTFLFSSCLHELVIIMVVGRVRMYLFVLQMLQIPLIYLGRLWVFQKYPLIGNVAFWLGMISGPPMLTVLYCRENYLH
ncbi:Sterol O-acyltransferase 2 (Sterol-ester synthase 2) [Dimargaris xerosporica]|nr:Sterol O-acyltransferase 2 (Sterol-ester synthase 2) [Dimargaris xerosporica]